MYTGLLCVNGAYEIQTCQIQNCFTAAYQTTFSTRVVDVLSEWGSLYVLLKDGRVSKDTHNRPHIIIHFCVLYVYSHIIWDLVT